MLQLRRHQKYSKEGRSTAAPTLPFVSVTSTQWRSFIPTVATTTASTIMTMFSFTASLRELLNLLHNFFEHIITSFRFITAYSFDDLNNIMASTI